MFQNTVSLSNAQTNKVSEVIKEVTSHRKLKLVLVDGLEECCYACDDVQPSELISTILMALLSSKCHIICTIRTEYMQRYVQQDTTIGWTLYKMSEWSSDQINRFTNSRGIKQYNYHLKNVLGVAFYADLFVQNIFNQDSLVTKRELVQRPAIMTNYFISIWYPIEI
jgi:hypothetical protein